MAAHPINISLPRALSLPPLSVRLSVCLSLVRLSSSLTIGAQFSMFDFYDDFMRTILKVFFCFLLVSQTRKLLIHNFHDDG